MSMCVIGLLSRLTFRFWAPLPVLSPLADINTPGRTVNGRLLRRQRPSAPSGAAIASSEYSMPSQSSSGVGSPPRSAAQDA
jgi:hypothetical protein